MSVAILQISTDPNIEEDVSMNIYNILSSKEHNKHYLNRYIKFINSRKLRIIRETEKTETHHILPKAKEMFFEYKNLRKFRWNGVKLTLREHYIAHLLLYKTFNNQSTMLALKFMIDYHMFDDQVIKNSKLYEKLRSEYYIFRKNQNTNGKKLIVDEIEYSSITKYVKSGNCPIGIVSLLIYLKEYNTHFPEAEEGIYFSEKFLKIKKLREKNKVHNKPIIIDNIQYQSKQEYFKQFENKPYTIPQLDKFIKDYKKYFPTENSIISDKFLEIIELRRIKRRESQKGINNTFYNKSHSQKTKKKISSRDYSSSCKKVRINGIEFKSITEAENFLNIHCNKLREYLKKEKDFSEIVWDAEYLN